MYFYLLIFCGIWSQRIIGTFADGEINESSAFLRQKRVVNYVEWSGAKIARIEDRPYIVNIKMNNEVHCVGTILSHRVVLTTLECAQFDKTAYEVVSKSAHLYHGTVHNVTNIKLHNANIHGRRLDGIALLTISPAILYGPSVRNIELHAEPLLRDTVGTVSGWGYNYRNRDLVHGTNYPLSLRTIQVPIISHQECVNKYRNIYPITDKDICTFHPERHCGHSDGGAPLVIDNLLVGIFLRSGPVAGPRYNREYPEIFALLQDSYYRDWIRNNI